MAASVRSAQIREDLAKYRERARRGTYPEELRDRAVAYVAERVRAGVAAEEIAKELGVRKVTAVRWTEKAGAEPPIESDEKGPALSLIPLVVCGQRQDDRRPRLRIDLPDGTRVHASGLAVSDLVEALHALRRGR